MIRVFHKAFDVLALVSFVAVIGFIAVPVAQACCEDGCLPDPDCPPLDDGGGGGESELKRCCSPCGAFSVLGPPRACCDSGSTTMCHGNVNCSSNPCTVQGQNCFDCE